MKKVIFLKGLPASGKTTWAKEYQKKNPNTVRVNKDDLRSMLHDSVHSKGRENFVLRVRDFIIDQVLKDGHEVIVDDTNLNPKHALDVEDIAKQNEAKFETVFLDVATDECIKRDRNRAKPVGEEVILDMKRTYLSESTLDGIELDKIFLVTDTHFGHQMLIDVGERPSDVDSQIVANWNAMVGPNDVVVHLGDVIFGLNKERLKGILDSLNGKKILVRGNHDLKPVQWYRDMGFSSVYDRLWYKDVLLTHIPQAKGNWRLNIHGHLHNNQHRIEQVQAILTDKHVLLSLEKNDYRLWKLKELIQ